MSKISSILKVCWMQQLVKFSCFHFVLFPAFACLAYLLYVIVISLSTVEYTSVSRVYSTVDSDITNLIHGLCKLSGASSGFDGWLYVPSQV